MVFGAAASSIPTGPAVRGAEKLIVAEQDVVTFHLTHEKALPLFASPLVSEEERLRHEHAEERKGLDRNDSDSSSWLRYIDLSKGDPPLKLPHESNTIQLFYDLFFVANLTTFTSVHEINDKDTLKSYIGFFSMLWFTWLQVSLFDIRFGSDSVFERICKALQFGVMAGFAVVGPGYKVGWEAGDKEAPQAVQAFKTLSLILMLSRLILVGQYTTILLYLRRYKKAILPLALHIGIILAAAVVYLGLYWSFHVDGSGKSLRAWYVCIGVESALILLVSGRYRFLSFRRTCIYERLGLLTLIILGEGIIGLCSSIQKIQSDLHFEADIVGMVISGIVIIYAIWMLYFDQIETERVGTLRQQIWVMAHFPYHVAILLSVEGVSQLCVWRKLTDLVNELGDKIEAMANKTNGEASEYLTGVFEEFFKPFEENSGHHKTAPPNITEPLSKLRDAPDGSNEAAELVQRVFAQGVNFVAESLGIEPPEKSKEEAASEVEVVQSLTSETFTTIFVYFFLAAGLTLILTAILFLLGKRHKIRADFINLAVRLLVGIGLSLTIIMALSDNPKISQTGDAFAWSAWVLPTVAIAFTCGKFQ